MIQIQGCKVVKVIYLYKEAMGIFSSMADLVSDLTPLAVRGTYLGAESVDEQTDKVLAPQ